VKTAISIPDEAFRRVERHAAKLHISRSEFFTRAAERWADELEDAELSQAIDAALDFIGGADDEDGEFVREAARRTLARADEG
jgi:metal-responsive CopG/Arc/MetJ family transcriptional regulator